MLFKKNGIQYTSFLNLLIKLLSEFNYKVILGDFFLTNQIIQALRFNLNTEEYTSADVFAIWKWKEILWCLEMFLRKTIWLNSLNNGTWWNVTFSVDNSSNCNKRENLTVLQNARNITVQNTNLKQHQWSTGNYLPNVILTL